MRRFLPCLLLVLAILPGAAGQDLKATIRKLDLETGLVVVRPLYQNVEQEWSLGGKDIPVTNAVGGPAKLTDLRVGSRVVCQLKTEFITAIKLEGPSAYGTVKNIDPARRTLELEETYRTHHLTLAERVPVLVNGTASSLDGMKVGQAAQVLLSPDGQSVLQVIAGKTVPTKDPFRKFTRLKATLLDLDAAGKTLTSIVYRSGGPVAKEKLALAPNAAVRYQVDSRIVGSGRIADLKGMPLQAYLVFEEDTQSIDAIELDLPTYGKRKILAVDLEAGKVRIEDQKKSVELALDPEAQILVVNAKGQPGDLRPGRTATFALAPDRSRIIFVYFASR